MASSTNMGGKDLDPACREILERLMSHPKAGPFLEPVDAEALGIPDYFTVVKHPMDLGTIRRKLELNRYQTEAEFAADVRQVFHNCRSYNQASSEIVAHCDELAESFEKDFAPLSASSKKRKRTEDANDKPMTRPEKRKLCQEISKMSGERLAGVVEIIQTRNIVPADSMEIEINIDELDIITLRELEQYVRDTNLAAK
ncbi:uncharacterized protein AMSG_11210 [Thecamonas trahens ATCC 50062]|uniref:Bromo domain-containing protein n=1 Tax=Thecamonas trahens ATCC 50062 TaxID=461836 RepID=A0A0L0DTW9_THETB|nr:hypothetical protein AMSG_11210 [Thecamonas trahens ATCC 50062]KNC55779.1 hypothetical protein AMSG_11210 [Thecamonas trahens ATCC 50062]|eukprot:XP_013752861.1 hypothetical protein AMSG_11210 [Thecamonas trahens ATCC 50062]